MPTLLGAAPAARIVEITAPADVLAQRLAQRGREHGDGLATRLSRTTPTLAPALLLSNAGSLDETVDRLDAAWRRWALGPPGDRR